MQSTRSCLKTKTNGLPKPQTEERKTLMLSKKNIVRVALTATAAALLVVTLKT
jgi:hypothetical protein